MYLNPMPETTRVLKTEPIPEWVEEIETGPQPNGVRVFPELYGYQNIVFRISRFNKCENPDSSQ